MPRNPLSGVCRRGAEEGTPRSGETRAATGSTYRYWAQALEQLTRDHSVAFEQYEAGALTKEQLRDHPNQRLLRHFRARSDFVVAEIFSVPHAPGDRYLVCSDGLTKALSDSAQASDDGDDTTVLIVST